MAISKQLHADLFNGILRYSVDSPSGLFWDTTILVGKMKNRAAVSPGQVAGTLNKETGYYQFRYKSTTYMCHRVVYAIVKGVCPENCQIDHLDGNKLNNVIHNLRVVTDSVSNKNRKFTNNTGIPFTHWSDKLQRFQVQFTIKGKRVCKTFPVSQYSTWNDAKEAARLYVENNHMLLLDNEYTLRAITKG